MNGIMVDIVAVVLIAIFVIVGIKRGFAKEVIDFVMGIVLIPICLILMIPISGIIVSTTKIDKTINNYVVENVIKLNKSEDVSENKKNEGLLETEINKIIKQNRDKGIEEVANIAGKNITDGIIKGISFIAAYVLLTIVVIIFRTKISGIIKGTNSILGGVFGATKALLIIFIVLTIVQIVNITGKNEVKNVLNSTILVKEIERFNPITGILLKK